MENRTDQERLRRDPGVGQQSVAPYPQREGNPQRTATLAQQSAGDPGHDSSPSAGQSGPSAGQRVQREAEATKQQLADAARNVKNQAAEMRQAVSAEAGQAADDARRAAVQAGERLKSEGLAIFSRQRTAAAEELTHLRDALHAASEKLHDDEDHRVADITQVAADRIAAVADYIRDQNPNQLASDVAQLAHRRPAVFYGGLFAVGLAASRFLKSSSHRRPSSRRHAGSGDSNRNSYGA